jgi:pyrroline-5-carboxylate reductase
MGQGRQEVNMRIGVIGAGKMGEAIIQGLCRLKDSEDLYQLQATTRAENVAEEISQRLCIPCHIDNLRLVESSDVIILCTKPYQAETILKEIGPGFKKGTLLITICASLNTQQVSEWSSGRVPVIRAMPNTPCLIGEGVTVLSAGPGATENQMKLAQQIFDTLGKTAIIDESLMDGATGLSGCGPAYVYLMIEALSEAGVKVGLPRKVSTLLAAQTLSGAAQMVLKRDVHPAALKDEVTTPAGCTIDGIMALEDGKLRATLIKAVLAATERSKALGGGL